MATGTKEKKKAEEDKTAFIIAPIGQENSLERRRIDGLDRALFGPVLKEFELDPVVSGSVNSLV
jgi:hypothetical protein